MRGLPVTHSIDHRGGVPVPSAPEAVAELDAHAVQAAAESLASRLHADHDLGPMFVRGLDTETRVLNALLKQWASGRPLYAHGFAGRSMRQAHAELFVHEKFANRWLGHLTAALRDGGAAEPAVRVIVDALRPVSHALVNRAAAPVGGEKLRCCHPPGWDELVRAARSGDDRAIARLVPDVPGALDAHHGPLLLQAAATRGRAAVIDRLLTLGVDVNHAAGEGPVALTPLCAALDKRKQAAADQLVEAGALLDVFSATWLGLPDLDDILDTAPALVDVNDPAMDFADSRPIHHAVHAGRADVAGRLLDRGASPESHPASLVGAAANAGALEVLDVLLAGGANPDRLPVGRWIDDEDIAGRLSAAGIDVEDPPGGWIRYACSANQNRKDTPERMRRLLAMGADPNAVLGGVPALHAAARSGFTGVVTVLIEAGARVDARAAGGATVLHASLGVRSKASVVPVVEVLLDAGADPSVRDGAGRTFLDALGRWRHRDAAAVRALVGVSEAARRGRGRPGGRGPAPSAQGSRTSSRRA